VNEVVTDLNATTTIVEDTYNWFVDVFGPEGVVTLNMTGNYTSNNATDDNEGEDSEIDTTSDDIPEESGNSSSNIPVGMEDIVAWIEKQVQMELRLRCKDCDFSNDDNTTYPNNTGASPDEGDGEISGEGEESGEEPSGNDTAGNETTTDNETCHSYPFTYENYTLPEGCSTTDNETVCCTEHLRSVCYTFDQINDWYDEDINSTCSDAHSVFNVCEGDAQCYRMRFFNQF